MYKTKSATRMAPARAPLAESNFCRIFISLAVILLTVVGLGQSPARAERLFYTTQGAGTISRGDLFDGGEEVLVTGLADPAGLELDIAANKMYWVDGSLGKVQRANLDGSLVEDLVVGITYPFDLALDLTAGKMYWTDRDLGTIQRANLDGTVVEELVSGVFGRSLVLDPAGGKMYFATIFGTIQRANLDGTLVEGLVAGLGILEDLAIDPAGGKLYWSDRGTGLIQRANLVDGSGLEDVIVSSNAVRGPVLDLQNGRMFWTDTFVGHFYWSQLDGTPPSTSYPRQVTAMALDLTPDAGPYVHDLRFFLDPDLISGLTMTQVTDRLAKYTQDINTIFAKNTSRQFAFDPATGLVLAPTKPHSDYTLHEPRHHFEMWAHAVLTDLPAVGSYGGYASTDSTGAGVAAGLRWLEVWDRDLILPGSVELQDYWQQVHVLVHEFAHVFGAGLGEYYSLNAVSDVTGLTPDLTIDETVFAVDPFWRDHPDYLGSPLRQNIWNDPLLGSPTSLPDLLAAMRFADVTAAVIDVSLRSASLRDSYLPDMAAIRLQVVDATSLAPVANAAVMVWSVVTFAPFQTTQLTLGTTDAAGEFVFPWAGVGSPFSNSNHLRLIKVTAPGMLPGGKWISTYDAQATTLLDGLSQFSVTLGLTADSVVPVPDGVVPLSFALEPAAPNPFNPLTNISYVNPRAQHVRLEVYDVAGRRVRTLHDDAQVAGRHVVRWDGRDNGSRAVASSVYFLRLQAGSEIATEKLLLLR